MGGQVEEISTTSAAALARQKVIWDEIVTIKRNILSMENMLKKPEFAVLMSDPVYGVEILRFVTTADALGLRIWRNKVLYGMIDFTQNGLRALCSSLGIPGYQSMSKEAMLVAVANKRSSESHLTDEEREDATVPENVPGGYLNPLSPHKSNLGK